MRKGKKNVLFLVCLASAMVVFPTSALAEQKVTDTTVLASSAVEVTTSAPVEVTTSSAVEVTTSSAADVITQPTSNKFAGDGYEVEFKLNCQYAGGFQGEFVITNTGDKPLENWAIKCNLPHEIINMWNGQIVAHDGAGYIIKNAQWNQDIPVGGSAYVGFAATCDDKVTLAEECQVLTENRDLNPEEYSVDFNVRSDWGGAFVGDFEITNTTENTIEDWILEFDFDKNIDYSWGLQILKHEGNHYVIKNSGYNQNIKPGQKITVGFQGSSGNLTVNPSNYKMAELLQGDYSFRGDRRTR